MFIFPNFNDGVFYRKVQYVDDVIKAVEKAVTIDNNQIAGFNISKWGLYKNKRWSFQNESRFTLAIFPKPKWISIGDSRYATWLNHAISNGISLPFSHFDLELDDSVLQKISMTLCPSMSEGNKTIVRSLCSSYLDNIQPIESSLDGIVNLK